MTFKQSVCEAAAIQFALTLGATEGHEFLLKWNQGDFPEIRQTWPDCPNTVFAGAETEGVLNTVYQFRAMAYSVECPSCHFELTSLLGNPSGTNATCDECNAEFYVSRFAEAYIE